MKIVVFGATGRTGQQIVTQALQAGYHVTAAVRTPSKVTLSNPALEINKADVYDPSSVADAIAGQDAVLSCVSPNGFSFTNKTNLFTQSAKAILLGMQSHNIKRLLIVSTSARREYSADNHSIFELIIKRVFWRTLYSDVVAMDDLVMASNVNWTLIRPPRVADKPQTNKYQVLIGKYAVPGGASIGRADLAAYMVSIIADEQLYRQNVAVAY